MGKAIAIYKELRFVIEDELTQVYVLINVEGDAPIGVQGWHHKTFAASKSIADVVLSMDTDSPTLWSLKAPPRR